MANIRLLSLTIIDSTHLSAKFTANLSPLIGIDNINITSETNGVQDPNILSVEIIDNIIEIIIQPLVTQATYIVNFINTETVLFKSLNGDATLLNDGKTNRHFIVGPVDPANPIKDSLLEFFKNNVYDLESPSVLSKYVDGLSLALAKALYTIGQTKNNNYLSFTVTDELKTRGSGAYDRLNQEGAYEISRIATTPTESPLEETVTEDEFPYFPVSLLSTNAVETLILSNTDFDGSFNLKTLTINATKFPAIILNSVTIVYNSILAPFVYDVTIYGYQVKNSKYDPEFAFTYISLEDNQFKLSDKVLDNSLFSLENIASITIDYQYKDQGKIIDPTTLSLQAILSSGRETLPAIENVFNLKNAPIVNSNNVMGEVGDITFLDPNAYPGSNTAHPAFLYEIPFRLESLPARIGEYAVDYATGTVYVFGENIHKTGTGAYPPLAVYYYRHTFQSEIDYVYDQIASDVVSLPNGSLEKSPAFISYSFEKVLIKDVDYRAEVHKEELSERIENRLDALNVIRPSNFPITNVFRIFNETSGEIYSVSRWNESKIFFNYQTPPKILDLTKERAIFDDITNETLFVSSTNIVSITKNIFKIFLLNNNVISASEDGTAHFKNTSLQFSDTVIFNSEFYYDNALTESQNNSRISNVGDYQVDYINGVIWVIVSSDQDLGLGTVSYKRGYIRTQHPHIITVNDMYYKLNYLSDKIRSFDYVSFTDTLILPLRFDRTDENFLNGDGSLPYQIYNENVGAFESATFTSGVTDYVKYVRGLFEREDMLNSVSPINFATATTVNGKSITVSSLDYQEYQSVQWDGYNSIILTNTNVPYLSSNIDVTVSVIRLSDSVQLWDGSGIVEAGTPLKLILSGVNSPVAGDSVLITYSFKIANLSRVVVDYSRGDYLVDYSYLADEIIISYEYGDNIIDFSKSNTVEPGDQYYVTYKVGALRDALLKNFGTLIDIPILNNLNVDFPRERYRDALIAAMQSFTQGPTVASLNNIVQGITHSPPEIIESAFRNWALGTSLLSRQKIATTGTLEILPAKHGNGVLITDSDQTISFPVISNLRIEEGTMDMWVVPQWNGIDNQAGITFEILKDGYAISDKEIFIGPSEDHPASIDGAFTVQNLNDNALGIPNKNKDGIYIYLSPDSSGAFDRWYVDVVDGYSDGYVANNLTIKISTEGKFYDVKSSDSSITSNGTITSGTNAVTYKMLNAVSLNEGITFTADYEHYLFDFGETSKMNRFSIYRDASGYINFRVIDIKGNVFVVNGDVSSWAAGEQHHVAISWILNSKTNQDEMHLFLDGEEVSNIIRYGNHVSPLLHQKFRTISTEDIIGEVPRDIVGSTDMVTTIGVNTVTSSINFTDQGIQIGDILYIEETGFNTAGYTITNVNGNTLTLSVSMPLSATNCEYSVNKTSFIVETQINLYNNVAISVIHSVVDGIDLVTTALGNSVSSASANFLTAGIAVGDLIKIDETGFEDYYTILTVSAHTLTLSDNMPLTTTGSTFLVYSVEEEELPGQNALFPSYTISRDDNFNNILTLSAGVAANDIILIRTLGLNHGRVRNKYYLWGNSSNILNTRLPSPLLLEDVKIYHTLLDTTVIGPNNSTLSLGVFTSSHIITDQPSASDNGRTLSVTISGDNINYSTSVSVAIRGTINGVAATTETVVFSENSTKDTVGKISQIDYIIVTCKPINSARGCATVKIREKETITTAENSTSVPVIRYSYQMLVGNDLSGTLGSSVVTDTNVQFSTENIGNYLIIYYPPSVAGQYLINDVSDDLSSITLAAPLAATFTGGNFEILNISKARSGLQNGKFTFEEATEPGVPYTLNQGLYELDYHVGLSIPVYPKTLKGFIGSDFNGSRQAKAIIDDFCILDIKLSDTRIGETLSSGDDGITRRYNALKAFKPNSNTLMLLDFDTDEFENNSDVYLTSAKGFIQSSSSVNSNFNKSISFTDNPLLVDNTGILNTKTEGTVEFWINPLHDTGNDPNYRFYFDASGIVTEQVVSTNNATVVVAGRISEVLNVKLKNGSQSIDYFAGGIIDDDLQTIFLNQKLPNQETAVVVTYIPTGLSGDRMSIYKDPSGYINFTIDASGVSHQVRAPIFWPKNSWHKLKAQYKVNQGIGNDEMRFFIDGYEQGNILMGNGLLFGEHMVFGSSFVGHNSIRSAITFTDVINEFTIGSDYTHSYGADALIDNLRISNVSRPVFMPFGEPIDPGYSTNLDVVFPATEDLYTTLLLDFNKLSKKTTDFAIIKNRRTGLFDITINVYDSFGILNENNKAKTVMETLISTLKPANSRVFINYR